MSESVKFTEEELKTVKEIQDGYSKIQNQLGQLSIAKIRLTSQMNTLNDSEIKINEDFENLQLKEKDFLSEVTKKYGEGTLNPETGEFTPNK